MINPSAKMKVLNNSNSVDLSKIDPVEYRLSGGTPLSIRPPKRSQKNFKAEQWLIDEFEMYCEYIAKMNFTDVITAFMTETVKANSAEIERLHKALRQ